MTLSNIAPGASAKQIAEQENRAEAIATLFYQNFTTPQLNPRGYVRDIIPHVRPNIVASWLLAGRVVGRKSNGLLPSSRKGDGLYFYSIIFDVDGQPTAQHLDAVGALLVRDRLLGVINKRKSYQLSTERAEAGISFCNGVLRILERVAPKPYHFAVDHVYPFAAGPHRLIASSVQNDPRLQRNHASL